MSIGGIAGGEGNKGGKRVVNETREKTGFE